jgi:diacylglycerol O-acyltransferase / wax synthase
MTVDSLSALDESFLRLETPAAHMHVGWTLLLDGEPPSLRALRRHVAGRLALLPRFRRRVVHSRLRLHDPVWVDDEEFAVARHVLGVQVPPGGGTAELRTLAGELLSAPLDRRRPLWRLYMVTGLRGGRFAIVGQAHHALTDGLGAVALATLLLDREPVSTAITPRSFEAAAPPGVLERIASSTGERLELGRRAGTLALRTLMHPGTVAEGLGALRRLGGALAAVGSRAPATALNRPIGSRRAVAFARLPLPVARDLGRRVGAGDDDVVLATAALALGRYLRRADECHPWLRVLVPVNTRGAEADELGNQVSAMFVELPVGERDPAAVLGEVARQSQRNKRVKTAEPLDAMFRASRLAPAPLRDVFAWLLSRPQAFNAVLSNVPGPAEPRYLLGRRVQAAYPAIPLAQGHGLSIGVLSYCGSLHVGLYADPEIVPDVVAVARDFAGAFDSLRLAIDPHSPRPRRRRRESRPRVRRVVAPA